MQTVSQHPDDFGTLFCSANSPKPHTAYTIFVLLKPDICDRQLSDFTSQAYPCVNEQLAAIEARSMTSTSKLYGT